MQRFAILGLITLGAAVAGFGQRFEASPYVGFGPNGRLQADNAVSREIQATPGISEGFRFGYYLDEEGVIGFDWNRHNTELRGVPKTSGPNLPMFKARTDTLHMTFIYNFDSKNERLQPYALGGVGATVYTARTGNYDNEVKPSFALAGGVRVFFTKHVGLRMEARWTPTWLTGTGGGFFCQSGTACAMTLRGKFQFQSDFTAGPIFRF